MEENVMGLFKEINCAECGEKTNVVMRMKLVDGNYICSKCKKAIPKFVEKYAAENYTLEDYKHVKEWAPASIEKYGAEFKMTEMYGEVEIDRDHGLFKINQSLFGGKNTPILKFEDVVDFDFGFNAKEYKEGMLGGKVTGESLFCVTMREPRFYYETVLDSAASAKAKKSFFGNKVTFEHPKRLQDFEFAFITALIAFAPEEDTSSGRDALAQAMSLFMIDDIGAIDARGLEEVKNNLLSSFQGSSNEKHIERINKAYDILKDKVAK